MWRWVLAQLRLPLTGRSMLRPSDLCMDQLWHWGARDGLLLESHCWDIWHHTGRSHCLEDSRNWMSGKCSSASSHLFLFHLLWSDICWDPWFAKAHCCSIATNWSECRNPLFYISLCTWETTKDLQSSLLVHAGKSQTLLIEKLADCREQPL